MTKIEILEKVQDIFRDVLDNDDIVVLPEQSADDIEEYDSLAHVQLIVAMEKEFGIKFKSKDILSWDNFGEMIDCIDSYLS